MSEVELLEGEGGDFFNFGDQRVLIAILIIVAIIATVAIFRKFRSTLQPAA